MNNKETVTEKIEAALNEFLSKDWPLIENDANEVTLTTSLKPFLEKHFDGYNVTCEYNRIGSHAGVRKRVTDTRNGARPGNKRNVKPDIIIHHMTKNEVGDNFVAIEAKKFGQDNSDDRIKLELYKKELGYEYAFLITFPNKDQFGGADVSSCVEII